MPPSGGILIMESLTKRFYELFKGFSKGEGLKGGMKGMEGMQNATMLPILLQQLFGGE